MVPGNPAGTSIIAKSIRARCRILVTLALGCMPLAATALCAAAIPGLSYVCVLGHAAGASLLS
jgi:hypothetical protein